MPALPATAATSAREISAPVASPPACDAVAQVAALAGQRDVAALVGVEARAERDEAAYGIGSLGHERVHGCGVAQTRPGDEGVDLVLGGRVVGRERSGDAALRPAGGALVDLGLGHDQHAVAGGAGVQRGGEPGDAGAHDDDVDLEGPAGGGRGEAPRETDHAWPPIEMRMLSSSRVVPIRTARISRASPCSGGAPSIGSVTTA